MMTSGSFTNVPIVHFYEVNLQRKRFCNHFVNKNFSEKIHRFFHNAKWEHLQHKARATKLVNRILKDESIKKSGSYVQSHFLYDITA